MIYPLQMWRVGPYSHKHRVLTFLHGKRTYGIITGIAFNGKADFSLLLLTT